MGLHHELRRIQEHRDSACYKNYSTTFSHFSSIILPGEPYYLIERMREVLADITQELRLRRMNYLNTQIRLDPDCDKIGLVNSKWSAYGLKSHYKSKVVSPLSANHTPESIAPFINYSAKVIFEKNKAKGFWDNERNIGELLMLVTSELGEAMEAHRKGRFADWSVVKEDGSGFVDGVKDSFEDEIADAIIRLLDMSAGLGIDLEKHINAKLRYNESRPRLHGKLY